MHWLNLFVRNRRLARKRVLISLAAAIVFLGVPPAWTQNDGPVAPSRGNVLETSSIREYFSRYMRPQIAEAAPRTTQRPQRVRSVRARHPAEVAAPLPAPRPVAPAWPNAQDSAGTGKIIPVELKTVRELAEPEAEPSLVHENELSDLDMAAQPLSAQPLLAQSEAITGTDGRATSDDMDFHGNRFAAFAENVRAMGNATWLEPLLLALAGAIAAVAALRIFAKPTA